MAKDFIISVIIPIYNVEDYLREALESVVNQTLGFEEHIKMILVNDGSTDGSEKICLEYREKYPENITYIYKENGGVSSARNLGIEHIDTKYVTFLDPDDKWEESSFENAVKFFEKHYDEIDVISARIQFFEAKTNFHSLDYKFKKGTRVADLTKEEELFSVESTAATTFIKSSALGDIRFDSNLKYGEDSVFINKLMLKKCRYGILCEALYLYRRRMSGDSAVNKQLFDKSFYINSLIYYHLELFRYSKELYGEVIPYVQSMVGYDIMWRFENPYVREVLDEKELTEYEKRVHEITSQIDDRIFLKHPLHKSMPKRSDAMKYKYGVDFFSELTLGEGENDGWLMFRDIPVFSVKYNKTKVVQVVKAAVEKGELKIDMLIANWLFEVTKGGSELEFCFGGKYVKPSVEDYKINRYFTSDGEKYYNSLCKYSLPLEGVLEKGKVLDFVPFLKTAGGKRCSLSMNYGKFVPAAIRYGASYKFYGDYGIKCYRTVVKVFYPANKKKTQFMWDLRGVATLIKRKRPDVIKARYIDLPRFKKKEAGKGRIWLISDRIDNAGDNGEILFRYICAHKPEGVRPMFVIGEQAKPEVKERLRSVGEVLIAESREYKFYFLMAEKIISSSAGEFTINAFDDQRHYYIDLYNFKYYFMNHGVNCGDCSKWLNKYNKNIHIMFATGESERQNDINKPYNYEPEQIVITGLARFDALYDNPKKQLLVLPTWRRAYTQCYDEKTSSIYYEGFKNTDFFKFYNGLITDERLLKVMREKGYTGLFCLHPIFAKQSAHFENSDVFTINEGFVDYNKAFAESSLMVTDYSTIAFDFAFLNKPIVYTQFDKEEFYAHQIYDECFDYANEGFGPICEDLESAVNELVRIIENDCKNDYLDRVEHFFVYHDQNNAKRILEAVLRDDE